MSHPTRVAEEGVFVGRYPSLKVTLRSVWKGAGPLIQLVVVSVQYDHRLWTLSCTTLL